MGLLAGSPCAVAAQTEARHNPSRSTSWVCIGPVQYDTNMPALRKGRRRCQLCLGCI